MLKFANGYLSIKILVVCLRPCSFARSLPSLAILDINAAGKGLTPVRFFLGDAGRCTISFSSCLTLKSSDRILCPLFSLLANRSWESSSNLICVALSAEHLWFRRTWHRTFSTFKNFRLQAEQAHFIFFLGGFFTCLEKISAQDIHRWRRICSKTT